jgi:hypothetical protein
MIGETISHYRILEKLGAEVCGLDIAMNDVVLVGGFERAGDFQRNIAPRRQRVCVCEQSLCGARPGDGAIVWGALAESRIGDLTCCPPHSC